MKYLNGQLILIIQHVHEDHTPDCKCNNKYEKSWFMLVWSQYFYMAYWQVYLPTINSREVPFGKYLFADSYLWEPNM